MSLLRVFDDILFLYHLQNENVQLFDTVILQWCWVSNIIIISSSSLSLSPSLCFSVHISIFRIFNCKWCYRKHLEFLNEFNVDSMWIQIQFWTLHTHTRTLNYSDINSTEFYRKKNENSLCLNWIYIYIKKLRVSIDSSSVNFDIQIHFAERKKK